MVYVVDGQREILLRCLLSLVADVAEGVRQVQPWYALKLWNDPRFNPQAKHFGML
jgi:hypothetical protein